MALNAEVLTSYKKIDEAYIDELLKKEIEKFNQNNIDWVKIREVGELDYSKPFLRDTRPKNKEVA